MFGLGFGELLVILLIALVFVGPKKLPELAKGLGKTIRDFQGAMKNMSDEIQNADQTPSAPKKVADASQQVETPESAPAEEKKDSTHS